VTQTGNVLRIEQLVGGGPPSVRTVTLDSTVTEAPAAGNGPEVRTTIEARWLGDTLLITRRSVAGGSTLEHYERWTRPSEESIAIQSVMTAGDRIIDRFIVMRRRK